MSRNILSIDYDYAACIDRCGPHCACTWKCEGCSPAPGRVSLSEFKNGTATVPYECETDRELRDLDRWINRFEGNMRRLFSLRVKKKAKIYVAECHADIMEVLKTRDNIFDFDYHSDADNLYFWNGDSKEEYLHCGNWVTFAKKYKRTVRQWPFEPQCKLEEIPDADMVFLCMSQPWVPLQSEPHFFALAECFAKRAKVKIEFVGKAKKEMKKLYLKYKKSFKNVKAKTKGIKFRTLA